MRISLLHATRGEPTRANATRVTWLDRAEEPHLIQHIWAVQEGDQSAADLCADSELVKTDDPPDWASSSVANWNAAAALATGDLLIVIADDLSPPLAWDYILRRAIIDPSKEFAVFVADQLANDGLLRHPILSRGLYSRRGYVFDPDYYGVFCDNDLTVWCDVNEVPVMRLRPEVLRWFHDHDMVAAVTAQQNRAEAYKYGETIFRRKWAAMIPRRVTETHSVWIGRNLSRMERLCLTLLVRHDHNPTLWVQRDLFEDYDGLPDGVNVLFVPDAYLPPVPFRGIPHPTIPNGGHGSFAQWSDWFAVYILSFSPCAPVRSGASSTSRPSSRSTRARTRLPPSRAGSVFARSRFAVISRGNAMKRWRPWCIPAWSGWIGTTR